mmetsp:Transcript_82042/g.265830  ORF Transcript_82042/g.265830 Transcript_82042/m.265830 type:complete len:115 (-) Transcript_82042:314-658(-)
MIMWNQAVKGDTILTPDNLQRMCRLERLIVGAKDYPEFCFLQPGAASKVRNGKVGGSDGGFNNSHCQQKVSSVVEMFYREAGASIGDCALLPMAQVEATSIWLHVGLTQMATFQ